MDRPYALGDLTRFSEAESLVGPRSKVQELCSVALDGQSPREQAENAQLDWLD